MLDHLKRCPIPPRVAARPDLAAWRDDELLTLPEAAALFWPDGPLTETTLRTAAREGRLGISRIAGKFFTNKRAVRELESCSPIPRGEVTRTQASPRKGGYLDDLRRIKEMGRKAAPPAANTR